MKILTAAWASVEEAGVSYALIELNAVRIAELAQRVVAVRSFAEPYIDEHGLSDMRHAEFFGADATFFGGDIDGVQDVDGTDAGDQIDANDFAVVPNDFDPRLLPDTFVARVNCRLISVRPDGYVYWYAYDHAGSTTRYESQSIPVVGLIWEDE